MNFSLRPVQRDEIEILRNLLEKYNYEFSQYTLEDVNALGLYGYDWLDAYWTEKNRFPYFLFAEGQLAGFLLVNDYDESGAGTDWSMAEFCVLYKYRRLGLGQWAANQAFDRHRGYWNLMCHPKNTTACAFWQKVVSQRTGCDYTLLSPSKIAYPDGTCGNIYLFNT